jgi:hypothetical protein
VLLVTQRGRFARGTDRDDPVHPRLDLRLDQPLERVLVNLAPLNGVTMAV